MEALAWFKKAESLDPNYAEAYYQAGETLTRLEKNTEAIAEYRRAVEIKPMFFDAWVGLGDAYFALNNYPEAVKAYKEAVRLNNASIEAYTNLGDANRLAGNYNDAEAAYTLATTFIERKPDYNKEDAADTYSKISFVIAKQCEISSKQGIPCRGTMPCAPLKRLSRSRAATSIQPTSVGHITTPPEPTFLRAVTRPVPKPRCRTPSQSRKGRLYRLKFVEGPLLNLALTLNDLGDENRAIDVLKRVVTKKPDWVFALNELGLAYRKQSNFSEAAKYFRNAIDHDGKYVYAYYNLAETEFRAGQYGGSQKSISKGQAARPYGPCQISSPC